MYMSEIGRWGVIDAFADKYEGTSSYTYAMNDPVSAIDPDGNLVIFVNGFMIDQWFGGGQNIPIVTRNGMVIENKLPPYTPERSFERWGPTYHGQRFSYWGNELIRGKPYSPNGGVGGLFSQIYNDYNTLFISATADNTSQAGERFAEGANAARDLIVQMGDGSVKLKDGETIKIIGHSQGAAFAAGMVSVLAKHSKYSSMLEVAHYISPHQPEAIKHEASVLGYQWSTKSDLVSSVEVGNLLLQILSGGSKYNKIDGIEQGNFMEREYYSEGMGGHYVETWIRDITRWATNKGIPVTIH